jgi:bacillithiol biosynthesis cysteine-adding enzyme BshC
MSFKITHLTFEEMKQFSKTLIDYVKGESYLTPFYPYKPALTEFKKVIDDISKKNIDRKLLVKTLSERYKKNAPAASEFTLKNIKLLEDKNCFTVTTGHQLCLFTGPLYFIYKIVSTVLLTQELREEYPNNHFVPIYWMASEDHDFAEVNHAYIFGKKIEWTLDASQIGGPVGRIPTQSLKPVLDNLFSVMGDGPHASELKTVIQEAYTKYPTFSEATLYLVDKLFGKYGLVILDADDAELKKTFIAVLTDELSNQSSFKEITTTSEKLTKAGVSVQVNPREINLFYIDEKGRNRIEKQGDKYVVVDTKTTFSKEEILNAVKQTPEKFSPNVVLRPLYQQSILPNVAYIGGPAEIAYWLELHSTFEHHNIAYPILMPRNFATIVDKGAVSKMDKLKLTIKDMFQGTEELIKEFVKQNSSLASDFEAEKEQLKKVYDEIAKKTKEIDSTLIATVEAELQKQYNALKTLETKLIRAQKQKDETSVNQIRKLKEKLFPEGILQERHDNFIPFYLGYGASFIDTLMQDFSPFDFRMAVMTEE